LTYPDGKLVNYEYEAADRLARVTESAYDGNGQIEMKNFIMKPRIIFDLDETLGADKVAWDCWKNFSQNMT